MPLDKTRAPVRRWRKAQRVIRGIAGGQWLASSWVGEKDSGYATATGRAPTAVEGGENTIPASAISAALSVKGKERSAAATAPSSGVASPALSMPKLPPLPGTGGPPRGAPVGKSRLGERVTNLDVDSAGGLMVGGMSTANSSRSGSAVATGLVEPFFANGGFTTPALREPSSSISRQNSFEGANSEPPPQMPVREIDEMYD